MKEAVTQFGKIMLIVVGFGGLAAALSSIPSRPAAAAGSAPVAVVNTPLPVQGTVAVSNFPATQSVSGTVNVGNTPSVNIANTPTVNLSAAGSLNVGNPLDSQGGPTPLAVLEAVQPYEDTCTISFAASNFAVCFFQPIPSGKRLVIQEFDTVGQVETGLKPVLIVEGNSLISLTHFFPATFMATFEGFDTFAWHQETHFYAPAGSRPVARVTLTGVSSGQWFCNLSGFLVDVP